jgi:hypothetical protein
MQIRKFLGVNRISDQPGFLVHALLEEMRIELSIVVRNVLGVASAEFARTQSEVLGGFGSPATMTRHS